MERRVRPRERVLGEAAVRGAHFMERGDAVAGFELCDRGPDGVDCACDVVARVLGFGLPLWDFPACGGGVRWGGEGAVRGWEGGREGITSLWGWSR